MSIRRIPIYRVGQKPITVLGGDRELVMFAGLLAFALAFAAVTWLATLFSIGLWTTALFVLRRMAKVDPLLRWVYLRQLRYRNYYPPRATPFRVNSSAQAARYRWGLAR